MLRPSAWLEICKKKDSKDWTRGPSPPVQDSGRALSPLTLRLQCKQSQWAVRGCRPDGLVEEDLLQETQLWPHALKLSASKMTSRCLVPFVVMIRSLGSTRRRN